jgi:hypothetical protein
MIKLDLTIEEANLVLAALGRLPYEQVFQIVEKIQKQAWEQLNTTQHTPV